MNNVSNTTLSLLLLGVSLYTAYHFGKEVGVKEAKAQIYEAVASK